MILYFSSGKNFMNQYFERMKMLAENQDLQPRIRFMLKDVIDLRHDGWVPRKAMVVEGPMPINQIGPVNDDRPISFQRDRERDRDDNRSNVSELFRHPMKTRKGFDEMLISKFVFSVPVFLFFFKSVKKSFRLVCVVLAVSRFHFFMLGRYV